MHVYVVESPTGVKVGISHQPTKRIHTLQLQGGFEFSRAWISIPSPSAADVERHAHLALNRSRSVGEWFTTSFDDAVSAVIDAMNSDQAKDESVADDNDIGEQSADHEVWSAHQFASRLNRALDARGYPSLNRGRQVRLGQDMDVSSTTTGNWLNGIKLPSMANMARLAHLLGVDVNWLAVCAYESPEPPERTKDQQELLRIFSRMTSTQRSQFIAIGRALVLGR